MRSCGGRRLSTQRDRSGATDRRRIGIVRTFQITEILPDLTIYENVRVGIETASKLNSKVWISRSERAAVNRKVEELLEIVNLRSKANRTVGELAHGDQRLVEVAVALSLKPRG